MGERVRHWGVSFRMQRNGRAEKCDVEVGGELKDPALRCAGGAEVTGRVATKK